MIRIRVDEFITKIAVSLIGALPSCIYYQLMLYHPIWVDDLGVGPPVPYGSWAGALDVFG